MESLCQSIHLQIQGDVGVANYKFGLWKTATFSFLSKQNNWCFWTLSNGSFSLRCFVFVTYWVGNYNWYKDFCYLLETLQIWCQPNLQYQELNHHHQELWMHSKMYICCSFYVIKYDNTIIIILSMKGPDPAPRVSQNSEIAYPFPLCHTSYFVAN